MTWRDPIATNDIAYTLFSLFILFRHMSKSMKCWETKIGGQRTKVFCFSVLFAMIDIWVI